ncbi:MAG: alcohol dehydrogenase catalytic domain-containing protein [Tepidanaerobacteraceae bacterium]|jgi:(R,R)-butanediol dehydrogenase/meso-butanediol dehydrogenase/diacetyl reductase|nr:alcohol dehydrogenase catalytic domain-containing protein [Tepidanaerobacteraceae bacterium]
MKAAVWYGHKDIRVMDVPEPCVLPGHVKIKVAYAGICGTDRHEYVGPNFIPAKKPHRLTGKMAPLIMGHEFSGVIVEVADDVKDWKVGDRVTASGNLFCGRCRWCREGRYNICEKLGFNGLSRDGGFAEYVVVPQHQLFKIPDKLSLKKAVLAEPLACGFHAAKLLGDLTGQKIVIVGAGMIGISCLIAAISRGSGKILVIGRGNSKEQIIRKLWVDYAAAKLVDAVEYTKNWSDGEMADIVFECVGTEQTLDLSLRLSRNAAKIMVMGVYESMPRIDMNMFQEGERILMSSQAYIDEIGVALQYLINNNFPMENLITSEIILDRIVEDGFEELIRNSGNHIKIIVKIADLDE